MKKVRVLISKRICYVICVAFLISLAVGSTMLYGAWGDRRPETLYLVTSDMEAAVDTIGNAPNIVCTRKEADAIAAKEYSKVFEITVVEK